MEPGTPHVLIVDDEPDIAHSVVDLLTQIMPGVRLDCALSGAEAVESIRRDPVDLVVTDFKMPGMNGVELLREVERMAPGTPNILVTAYGRETVELAGDPQPHLIMHKPIDVDKLVGAIQHALEPAA